MMKKYFAASALSLIAVQASADSAFDNFVVFGDSLLDTGNFVDLGGENVRFTNRIGDGAGDYSVGDYADISPQLLADQLNLTADPAIFEGNNYAVGGFTTAQILNAVTGTGLTLPAGSRNAYLADNSSISADTLVLLNGGGNDFLYGIAVDPASIQASAQNLATAVAALDVAGAKYIMLSNLPDLGLTAASQAADITTPGFAATSSAGVQGFNAALSNFTNFTGANVIPVDLAGLLGFLQQNPDEFGIANGTVTTPLGDMDQIFMCFDGSGGDCIEHPVYGLNGATPDPRRLIFNDGIHPTELVSELAADFMFDIVTASQKIGLLPEMAIDAARNQARVGADELRRSRWSIPETRWFLTGESSSNEYTNSFGAQSFASQGSHEDHRKGLNIGYIHKATDNLLLGAVLNLAQKDLTPNGADFAADSYGLTGLLGYRRGQVFADVTLSLTRMTYNDLERDFVLGSQIHTATGNTEGHAWSLGAVVGYNLLGESNRFHLGPAVSVQWVNAKVDGYTEAGGEISNYRWGDQSRKSQQWKLGFVGSAKLAQGITVYGEIFSGEEQEDKQHDIEITNTNLDYGSYRLPNFETEGNSFASASVGASLALGDASLSLTYHYSDQEENSEQYLLSYSMPL